MCQFAVGVLRCCLLGALLTITGENSPQYQAMPAVLRLYLGGQTDLGPIPGPILTPAWPTAPSRPGATGTPDAPPR